MTQEKQRHSAIKNKKSGALLHWIILVAMSRAFRAISFAGSIHQSRFLFPPCVWSFFAVVLYLPCFCLPYLRLFVVFTRAHRGPCYSLVLFCPTRLIENPYKKRKVAGNFRVAPHAPWQHFVSCTSTRTASSPLSCSSPHCITIAESVAKNRGKN
jgi:hypothetical protein